jgi:hypothetical protein
MNQPLSIGPPDSTIAGIFTVPRHQAGRRRLVAAGGQHHAVQRIAVQHFDQPEIGEVAVERGGRALAGLLDRMHGNSSGTPPASRMPSRTRCELDVMAVAGGQVGAGLRDADDRLVPAGGNSLRASGRN